MVADFFFWGGNLPTAYFPENLPIVVGVEKIQADIFEIRGEKKPTKKGSLNPFGTSHFDLTKIGCLGLVIWFVLSEAPQPPVTRMAVGVVIWPSFFLVSSLWKLYRNKDPLNIFPRFGRGVGFSLWIGDAFLVKKEGRGKFWAENFELPFGWELDIFQHWVPAWWFSSINPFVLRTFSAKKPLEGFFKVGKSGSWGKMNFRLTLGGSRRDFKTKIAPRCNEKKCFGIGMKLENYCPFWEGSF